VDIKRVGKEHGLDEVFNIYVAKSELVADSEEGLLKATREVF